MSVDTDRPLVAGAGFAVLLGRIDERLGAMEAGIDRIHKFMTPNPQATVIARPIQGSVTSTGTGYDYINLGSPAGGRRWDVRLIAVAAGAGAVDPFTSFGATKLAGVFTYSGPPPNFSTATLVSWTRQILTPGAMPADTPWGAHQVTIRPLEWLVVVIKGLASNDQVFASGQAEEYIESVPQLTVV